MPSSKWLLLIDTGGTFTDCLAYNPQGELHRLKVLSNSTLRGSIISQTSNNVLKVKAPWLGNADIFKGYSFRLLGGQDYSYKIISLDPESGLLTLGGDVQIDVQDKVEFEITGHEEVPVLAARLLTGTGLLEPLPPLEMRLGSTKGTNALLERKGAKVALVITKGFKDLLLIGTQQRPELFSLNILKPVPLYDQVIEVEERIDANGEVIIPLDEQTVKDVVDAVEQAGVASVAVAFMHSYLNPEHEEKLAKKLAEAGLKYVSLSSQLAPTIKILPRSQTAVANAYLSPVIDSYISRILSSLSDNTLKVMTSAGGLVDGSLFNPKDSLLSGPAGGIVGAAKMAELSGFGSILTLDVGGTSADVAQYNQSFDYRYESPVGDANIVSPSLAIETIAAGGGSICSFSENKFSVGPDSAGAQPGPACYGAGGPLTVTDVNLLLGKLDPASFGIPIKVSKAQAALEDIKQKIVEAKGKQYTEEELLNAFSDIANEKMAEAIRKISVKKGYDPSEYALVAFGGAGGQHACEVAALLNIDQVIIPYNAGLLSAYGIGQAEVERFKELQVLAPFDQKESELAQIISSLQAKAINQLVEEGYTPSLIYTRSVLLYLRFKGQENSIEIQYLEGEDPRISFKEKYEELYGHWLENQQIELESVKVFAALRNKYTEEDLATESPYVPTPSKTQSFWNGKSWEEAGVYIWEELKAGAKVSSPAVIVSGNSTIALMPGWNLVLDKHFTAILSKGEALEQADESVNPEEAQLELFTNRFIAVAEEMGALLQRTSFSVNVKERLDFSCALLDRHGELIVNAPHIPVHLGSLGICVRKIKETIDLNEGDIVISNHPAYGGSHLPDVTLVSAVYDESKALVGYVANRAHHAEIGGKWPGSMPADAKNLAEEGVVIAPMYLVKGGEVQWESIRQLLCAGSYPSRAIDENLADLNGAIASIRSGVEGLKQLCNSYTTDKVGHYMQALKDYARDSLIQSIAQLESDQYEARELLDDGSQISVSIKIEKSRILIDFSGSAQQNPGNLNATEAIVNSAVLYVLRLLVDKNIPLNEGFMKAVELNIPQGMLNPAFGVDDHNNPAVVGGNTEVSQRLTDTLLKALGMAACSQGTMNNLLFGNEHFGYYETICGGVGAGKGFDGADAVHQHMTNTKITDPEIMEFRYPVRLERFAIREHSGGDGKWKGGNGITREIKFLAPVQLTVLTQHRKESPYGLAGGKPGNVGQQFIILENGDTIDLQGVDGAQMNEGDRVIVETPGGGGFGSVD